MKKTALAAALTALAVPSAAVADHREPTDRGHGKDRSEQRRGDSQRQSQNRSRHQDRNRRGRQRVGFAVSGTGLTGSSFSTSTLTLPVELDVTSANKHARKALGIDRTFIAGSGKKPVGTADDAFLLRLKGVTDADGDGNLLEHVVATDRVKVIGKVTRTRTREADGDRVVTYGAVDVRKVVISRASAEDDDNS